MAFGFYRHPHQYNDGCDVEYFTINNSQWQLNGGYFCWSNLYNETYVNPICGNMENNLSSLRMQVAWQGCSLDLSDFN